MPLESSSSGQQIHLFSSNNVVDFGKQPLPTANTSGFVAQGTLSDIIKPSLSPASSCKITVSSFSEVSPTGQSTISDLSQPMPSIAMQLSTQSPNDLNETILEESAPPPPPILLPFPDLLEISETLAQFVGSVELLIHCTKLKI
ncbi:hypothetical protein O181_107429 [Austropuccinia psidii MF-1]|uniref:Uncharacterized protein n=1 Tax=Austropuccinia psidii MF-1 TaxID=1389203 RepID=A0A9Q3JU07_9BASI|nr:hypothetical protein [Austropuccinia psidii MF-1]